MARREYARIGVDMPDESSIKALPVASQWLYDRLLLRPEISRCGVVPWRPAVLVELAPDATIAKIARWTKPLQAGRQIVLDEPYAECLVRTHVRHDKLLASPNVIPALVHDFGIIASPDVRLAFLREFRRLWDLDDFSDSERGGWLTAVGHFPRKKHGRDDPAKWPVALESDTLARIVTGVGHGIREPLTSAIAAGQVEPFDPNSPHGIPDPFHPSHPTKGSPPSHPTIPSADPTPPRDPSRAHTSAPAPAHRVSENPSNRVSEEPGSRVRATGPDADPEQPAAAAADTHAHVDVDADQLIATHVGQTTGAVRIGLRNEIRRLIDDDHIEPITVAAALEAWASKPGSGPGLLAYLANDLLLDDRLKTKPKLSVNGSAPDWCGHPNCDPVSRWRDEGDGWFRCPTCHPTATPTDDPWTPPTPVLARADEPPF
jgi:hypothetical protein